MPRIVLYLLAGASVLLAAGAGAAELQVASLSPMRHSVAAPAAAVSITFDRALQTSSVTAASLRVFGRVSGTKSGSLVFSNGDKTVTLTPSTPFAAGETVLVNLADTIVAADTSPLRAAGYAYAFLIQTQPAPLVFQAIDTFSNHSPSNDQTRIYGAMAADLDHDGAVDLTTVNEVSSDLRVFLNQNDGSGRFDPFLTPPLHIGFESSPNEPGDFDNDGETDIAVSSTAEGSAWIALGNGNGTFAAAQEVATGTEPHGIAVLDIDGDGDLDLANAARSSDELYLLVNNGAGSFTSVGAFDSGGDGEYALGAADMNNDGITDLITGANDSEEVVVCLGNGDGTFDAGIAQDAGGQVWMLVLGDVNGDGNIDVAAANSFSNNGAILLGNGDGTLDPPVTVSAPGDPVATDLGDLDGDGDLDWVLSGFVGQQWRLYTNNGSGTFTGVQDFDALENPSCAVLVDLDGDGDLDMALTDEIADKITTLRNGPVSPCPLTPQLGCRPPVESGRSLLKIKDKASDAADQILWKWKKGTATTLTDFLDPATDDYTLCLYDDGALVASAGAPSIPTGGPCGGGDCWSTSNSSLLYKDRDLTPEGVKLIKMKAGAQGDASILVKGRGSFLQLPDLAAIDGPIEAQFIKTNGGICWGATFSAPFEQSDGTSFKDKAD